MRARFDYGDGVRVIRNVRNDGTYPHMAVGDLLVRRGSVGHVTDIGSFLQDQIIYTVHFLDQGRKVGCREEELIGLDEPWTPSLFEAREKVRTRAHLAVDGEVRVPAGTVGEVLRVIRDQDGAGRVIYHMIFPGQVLQVPEALLEVLDAAETQADLQGGAEGAT
ncbi:MAG: nitrogen fixation protein NifZ [Pseudomonadota bacterium]